WSIGAPRGILEGTREVGRGDDDPQEGTIMTAPRRALMVCTLAAAMTATPVLAQQNPASVDPAKASVIRHLLELTGAARLAMRGMEAMVPAQRAVNPQIPSAFWDAFLARARRDVRQ